VLVVAVAQRIAVALVEAVGLVVAVLVCQVVTETPQMEPQIQVVVAAVREIRMTRVELHLVLAVMA
jgi:hypothetical protein